MRLRREISIWAFDTAGNGGDHLRYFDLHADTLTAAFQQQQSFTENTLHVDLKRTCVWERYIQTLAVFVPDELHGEEAWQYGNGVLDYAYKCDELHLLHTSAELTGDKQRLNGLLAVENGAILGGRIDRLAELRDLGVKLFGLTWNGSNELGHGCMSGCSEGLTPLGKEAVAEMQRLGMTVDVAHLNEAGFWDAVSLLDGPLVVSHTASAAVCPHPRNITDRQFEAIRDRGGLVGLNLCAEHLGAEDAESRISQFEKHLLHFLELGGENTLAVGADWDGTDLPEEWHGISVISRLYERLSQQSAYADVADKIFFGNCYDFFTLALTKGPIK